jgi:putative thioredoxin
VPAWAGARAGRLALRSVVSFAERKVGCEQAGAVLGWRPVSDGAHVRDVGEADFDADVIERSHEIPVLVDFWAPWCGPCRMLGPVLEGLAAEMAGRFELVKVDTDAHPGLGMRYQVRSIPAVKLFHRGRMVTEFVGALPGGSIRKLLEEHLPSPVDDAVAVAAARATKEPGEARAALQEILAAHPGHASAVIALAKLALREAQADEVERLLADFDPAAKEAELAERLRDSAVFARVCTAAGGEHEARAKVAAEPDDLDARYALGCCLALHERWADALAELLEVVMKKASFRDRAAVKAMITIFGLMPRDDVRDDYQRKLQIYS